jgi:RNA polymerase sigma-B factor
MSAASLGSPPSDRVPIEALISRWRRSHWRERAVRRGMPCFDPAYGTRFTTFAAPTITGELRRHFRGCAWTIHASRSLQEAYLMVRDASDRIMQNGDRAPTVRELAAATGLDPETVLEALDARAAQRIASLDQRVRETDGEGTATLADQLGVDDPGYRLVEQAVSLAPALAVLTPRQRRIRAQRFGQDRVQREIAREIGCSQMQISRELRAALAELRETIRTGAA